MPSADTDLRAQYLPALSVSHILHTVTPVDALLYVPTSQSMQEVAPPELSAYVPISQAVQLLNPGVEYFPALHIVLSRLPPRHEYPAGHVTPDDEISP